MTRAENGFSKRNPRRLAAVGVLLVAAAASVATSQNAYHEEVTEAGPAFSIDEGAPTFSAPFTLHVVPEITNENKVDALDYQFVLEAQLSPEGGLDTADSGGEGGVSRVRLTILADQEYMLVPQPIEITVPAEGARAIRTGDWHTCWHDADCDSGYTAVFEWLEGPPVSGTWDVTLAATAGTNSQGFVASGTVLDVTFDEE